LEVGPTVGLGVGSGVVAGEEQATVANVDEDASVEEREHGHDYAKEGMETLRQIFEVFARIETMHIDCI